MSAWYIPSFHHHHLSLDGEGRWGTTDDVTTNFLHFPLFFTALFDFANSRPIHWWHFPDVVFRPLPLSALSSSPFHCALQDSFGRTWLTGDMIIPLLQFASLYGGQELFVWSDCLLDLGTNLLVGNMVFCMRCVVFYGSTSFPWIIFFDKVQAPSVELDSVHPPWKWAPFIYCSGSMHAESLLRSLLRTNLAQYAK